MSITAGTAAAIAAGSAALTTGGTAIANGVKNRKSYKYTQRLQDDAQLFQAEEAEKAWNRELEMWNMTNAYNTPLQQRKRMIEAGLNPFVEGSAADAGMAQMGDAPMASGGTASQFNVAGADFSAFGNVLPQMLTAAQIDKTNAETKNIEANTNQVIPAMVEAQKARSQLDLAGAMNAKAQAAAQELENLFQQTTFDVRVNQASVDYDTAVKSLAILDEELADKQFKNKELNPLEKRNREEMINYYAAQTAVLKIKEQYEGRLSEAQIGYLGSLASLAAQHRLESVENTRAAAANANIAEKQDEKFYADRTHKLVQAYIDDFNNLLSNVADFFPAKALSKLVGSKHGSGSPSYNLPRGYNEIDDVDFAD